MNVRTRTGGDRGQTLVEFALVLIPFLVILMGIVDMGRGIYVYNAVSQSAREIARVTSVHPYAAGCTGACDLGLSAEAQEVIAAQDGLIPGFAFDQVADIACVPMTAPDEDESARVIADSNCQPGDWVRVTVQAPFSPLTTSLIGLGDFTFSSTSRIQVP